ncbi:MAG TPA: alpha/beta hydrolase [Solirubrobacteraceae bacterium]|nr:alpha/beta hydrolase [Solirubrobacteraceae bacterium]
MTERATRPDDASDGFELHEVVDSDAREQHATVSPAVQLCFEERGSQSDPLVLLVMGLGLDLCWWRDPFFSRLAGRGFHAVRFDNRDVGRSTHFHGPGVSAMQFLRRTATPTYTLADMADDAAGLIAHLSPNGGAHVVGASMGAFIAQELAIRHPDRVRSLVSIMGRPGDKRTGRVAKSMLPEFLKTTPSDPGRAVEHLVKNFRRTGSIQRTEQDDEDVRIAMRRSMAREQGDGSGPGRQLAAILAERDRTADLRHLEIPATVIHGLRDRVILPSGGRATADAIPNAHLVEVPGMGHDLPRWASPLVLGAIERTVARAQ